MDGAGWATAADDSAQSTSATASWPAGALPGHTLVISRTSLEIRLTLPPSPVWSSPIRPATARPRLIGLGLAIDPHKIEGWRVIPDPGKEPRVHDLVRDYLISVQEAEALGRRALEAVRSVRGTPQKTLDLILSHLGDDPPGSAS